MPFNPQTGTISTIGATSNKVYSPKFFDSKLTGRGGTSNVGLLSAKNNPISVPDSIETLYNHYTLSRKVIRNGNITTTQIPVNTLPFDAWKEMKTIDRPDMSELLEIGTDGTAKLYMTMRMHGMILEETAGTGMVTNSAPSQGTAGSSSRKFITNYQVLFFHVSDTNAAAHEQIDNPQYLKTNSYMRRQNLYWIFYTSNPLRDLIKDQNNYLQKFTCYQIDTKAITDYLDKYDVYDSVVKRSEEWQSNIDKTIDAFLWNASQTYNANTTNRVVVEYVLKYIMNYNIPLELYRHIYQSITKHFNAADAAHLCKQNLNLLLSDTLNNLNNNKGQLITFQPPSPTVQLPASVQRLSPEQMRAVSSTEPLILVQAGAGSGKSTLILGRIDYLEACGVNPTDITVLSFTNAAADHITEKNPNVHSMTIARMIHEIYSANFQGHELSTLDTIVNSLDIYYPVSHAKHDVVWQFKRRLISMMKNEANHFTEMNNFIEDNYDNIIEILNTIHQTSLELEIIICYQKIDSFTEPASVASKFLIIDEVQDNSIFEFIYTLKYIDKHKESMFIVGDCSQTLYEFREANPRALNILEGSGTFATYQLNINYRSNQEILDFANVALRNIEANQYANIRLQANSLAPVTEQSFLERVHFNYHRLNRITDFHEALPTIFANEVHDYIKDCLDRKEQVAFLAFTRWDVKKLNDILVKQFPNQKTVSLVPDKMYNTTVMSSFIRRYWDDMKFAPVANLALIIAHEIMCKLPYLVTNDQKAAPAINKMLNDWKEKEGEKINIWVNQCLNNQITQPELLSLIKENMLQFEIKNNSVRQSLLSAKNEQAKQAESIASANFLLSTIHSAKGLEFDNVVILYRNDNQMPEDKKRMYYVAFTRAMKSEYILAYDTMASPQILADYNTILEELHAIAPAPNSPLNSIPKSKRVKI